MINNHRTAAKGGSSFAVLFHRLGPYHMARMRAAARRFPLAVIESSGLDETYAWDAVTGSEGFERVTLFENADAQRMPGLKVAQRIATALDKLQPKAVAVPGWADSAAIGALKWCLRNNIPAVVMSESTRWDAVRKAWGEAVKRQIVRLFSAGLAGGTPHADYLSDLGLPRDRVFLGYDAVDNDYFQMNAEKLKSETVKGEYQKKFGLPKRYFLATARFVEMKNLPRLLQAYARYRKLAAAADHGQQATDSGTSTPWLLVLLGDGPLKPELCRLIAELHLEDFVLLPGFKQYPELPVYFGLATAFVHVSTKEPWGLVVNEAMATALPVLVSRHCGCARDLVQEGVNGFTFDPYNVEEMAQVMLRVGNMEQAARIVMGLASQRIISNWGTEHFAEGLQSAFNAALSNGPGRANLTARFLLGCLLLR